jgi:hypothetical protein
LGCLEPSSIEERVSDFGASSARSAALLARPYPELPDDRDSGMGPPTPALIISE